MLDKFRCVSRYLVPDFIVTFARFDAFNKCRSFLRLSVHPFIQPSISHAPTHALSRSGWRLAFWNIASKFIENEAHPKPEWNEWLCIYLHDHSLEMFVRLSLGNSTTKKNAFSPLYDTVESINFAVHIGITYEYRTFLHNFPPTHGKPNESCRFQPFDFPFLVCSFQCFFSSPFDLRCWSIDSSFCFN